ncbi:hypothetical protein PXH69_21210 [Rhodococcus qingshengii]|uniref:DUF4254 domain-containing protein n=1 Tax=Rhodococcus qingshengii TaxID=334542 RepID=A0AAW6LU81_RHOSG|nr:hypothetical protein [Rhodococcus qingshengii]MDE8647495.1 hypothetical protein [Rhodococcus qingshengii]
MSANHRTASQINDTDTAAGAEYKAAMARTALCEIHIGHFSRVIALIEHARTLSALDDLESLYPLAFATVTTIDPTSLTHDSALRVARAVVDEMGLAVHELDWEHRKPAPTTADDELLRKSRAVVDEDRALEDLATVHSQLHLFETALTGFDWSSSFLQSPPFSRSTEGDTQ